MPGSIDQIQLIGFAILRLVRHADGVRLDSDAALSFQIHCIQHLGLHLTRGQGPSQFQ